jgi:predicted nucleic acid-binding protein
LIAELTVIAETAYRRDQNFPAFDRAIQEILGGRVLPFDKTAAERAAAIAARQHLIGQPVEIRDVQIARYRRRAQSDSRHAIFCTIIWRSRPM